MEAMMDSSSTTMGDSTSTPQIFEDHETGEGQGHERPGSNNHHHHDSSSNSNFSNESGGIDETEFKTSREESAKFFNRNCEEQGGGGGTSTYSFQDLFNNLNANAKKVVRSSLLSHVELEPDTKLLLLKADRTNIRTKYGYDSGRHAYLYPEEALYLLDLGKVEIFCGHVSLSVQRARSLLLVSQRTEGEDKLTNCTTEEYLVYKHLARSGYSLYRYSQTVVGTSNNETCDDDIMTEDAGVEDDSVEMEEDDDIIEIENSRANLKRKFSTPSDSESEEGLLDDVDEVMDDDDEFQTDPMSTAGGSSGYMVDEADSDVEIVDEVIFSHGGVEIEEISHSVGCAEDNSGEPVPSTSKGPDISQVVVDLVSSEDEEEASIQSFGKRVWSKFIPNSKVIFKQPPPLLLPENIPISDKIYELDLKDKSDVSDLELECLVDEVSLNDDEHGMSSSSARSWKEWRQNMFQEARDVMNDSLLASSTEYTNGESVSEKLCLWDKSLNESKFVPPVVNNIVFEMYGPSTPGYSRLKAFDGKPIYYVSITRQDDRIPEFGTFGSSINGVPLLIAVVCDNGENDVVFLTTDRSPLNSLFC